MKSKRKFLSIFAILFALVFALSVCFFAACGKKDDDEKDNDTTTEQDDGTDTKDDDDNEPEPSTATVYSVSVAPATLELEVGEDPVELSATVTMSEEGATFVGTYEWAVEPSGVVTVVKDTMDSTKATVTAVAAGEAIITVTAGGKSATCEVTVSEPYVDPYTDVADEEGLNAALETESYIRIADNITVTSTVGVAKNVTIDLNGNSIATGDLSSATLETAYNTVTVGENGYLTLIDSSEEGTGTVGNSYTGATSADNAAAIYSEGVVVLYGGTVESDSVGIRAKAGYVVIDGGNIESVRYTVWTDAGNVTVIVMDGEIHGKEKGIFLGGDNGNFGISADEVGEDAMSTLYVCGGKIVCDNESAISTLGRTTPDSVEIYIYDGEITGTATMPAETVTGAAPAIFMASGNLYVGGGTITGTTAIEVRGGTTRISDGAIVSTGTPVEGEDTENTENTDHGATTYGYSLAVFPYGSGVTVVTKTGNVEITDAVNVEVTGGTFEGAVYGVTQEVWTDEGQTSYTWQEYTFAITGGTFSEDPSAYLSDGYVATQSGEYYVVDEKPVELTDITTMSWAMADYKTSLDSYLSTDLDTATEYFFNTDNTVSEKNSEGSRFSYITKKKAEWGGAQVTHGNTTYSDSLKVAGGVSTSNGRYFKIDLSGVEADSVIQVEIVFCSNSNEAGNERSGYIATAQSAVGSTTGDTIIAKTGDAEQETALSSNTTAIGVVCTYTVLGEDGEALYLWADQNARYCGVNLTVSD